MSMVINFGRVGICNEEFTSFDHVVLQSHIKYFSCCITTTTRPIATKLDIVVTYYKKLQHGHVRSRDKLKIFLSVTQYLISPNLVGWLHTMMGFLP